MILIQDLAVQERGLTMFDFSRISSWSSNSIHVLVLALLVSGGAYAASSPYADMVILNGQIITANSDDPKNVSIEEAVAVRDDKIIAVGSNEDIRKLVADWTEIVDAKGNSVIPGLIDTCARFTGKHSHTFSKIYFEMINDGKIVNLDAC